MVSVHNAFVIAKFQLGEIADKKTWPNFQIFMEDVTRAFPACNVPRHPVLDHKIKWNLKKRKVCFACKRKPGNQCVGVTNFGCVRCQEPCHVHCLAEHSICEEEPVKNGDGKPAVAEDSNIPGNVAAEAVSRQRMGIPQTLKSVTDTAVYCEQVPVCVCFFSPHTFKFI